jgi:hypothetical protein
MKKTFFYFFLILGFEFLFPFSLLRAYQFIHKGNSYDQFSATRQRILQTLEAFETAKLGLSSHLVFWITDKHYKDSFTTEIVIHYEDTIERIETKITASIQPLFFEKGFIFQAHHLCLLDFFKQKDRILQVLRNFEDQKIPLSQTLHFVITSLGFQESLWPPQRLILLRDDAEWRIEQKITAKFRPQVQSSQVLFELEGVSLLEYHTQKECVLHALEGWKKRGGQLQQTLLIQLNASLSFNTFTEKKILLSPAGNQEEIEKVLSHFLRFNFRLKKRTLQVRGISIQQYEKARKTLKKLLVRAEQQSYLHLLPSVFLLCSGNSPLLFSPQVLQFPYDISGKYIETLLLQEKNKNKVYLSSETLPLSSGSSNLPSSWDPLAQSGDEEESLNELLDKSESSFQEVFEAIHQLDHWDREKKKEALLVLREYGSASVPALPSLLNFLQDQDQELRELSIEILGKIGLQGHLAVPALLLALEDPLASIRQKTAQALASLKAFDALPILRLNLNLEKEESVQIAYQEAILSLTTFLEEEKKKAQEKQE